MKTELQETELYKKFKKALNINNDMRADDNPFVVSCCNISKEQAIEFAAWIRTFDSLEKKQQFWIVESQVSDEELFNAYLKDRERWQNER